MKKKKRKILKNKLIIIFLFVFIACIGSIFFIKSDFFYLKTIKVFNNEILTKEDIISLSKIKINKNLFSYDTEKIKENINQSSYIESVEVKQKIPNSIIIYVKEKKIECIIKDKNDNYCYVDENLKYIDKIKYEEIKSDDNNYIIVDIDSSINNKKIEFENEKDKEKISSLLGSINKSGLDNKITDIEFSNENKINMTTIEGIKIKINKNSNTNHDMAKLTQILIDLKNKNINYGKIDMTFSKYTLYTQQ